MTFKKKLFIASLATALLSTAALAGSPTIDEGNIVIDPVFEQQAREKLLQAQQEGRTYAADSDGFIDVTVFMHPSYLDLMSQGHTKRPDGSNWENGPQFIVDRLTAQINNLNDTFALQNVNARMRLNYVGVVDIDIDPKGNTQASEHIELINCTLFSQYNTRCSDKDRFAREARIVLAKTDMIYYLRPYNPELDFAVGHGSFSQGISVYDHYLIQMMDVGNQYCTTDECNDKVAKMYDSVRFGNSATQVFAHEVGHYLDAQHQIREPELPGSRTNAAYACGKRDNEYGMPYVSGEYDTMKKTWLHHQASNPTNEHHAFFSDPDIIVDGDACGVTGAAENITAVRNYAPLFTETLDSAAELSDLAFAVEDHIITRAEKTLSLTVSRTGDLSQPTFATLVPRDGTAWHGRDFNMGLQEIVFEAGESEKKITVEILERSEKHEDTAFTVELKFAIGSRITGASSNVFIPSVNKPDYGRISAPAQLDTLENANITVSLSRTDGTDGAVSVTVLSEDGSAVAGTDFAGINEVVTFADGVGDATITVPVFNRTGVQGVRDFALKISNPQGGVALDSDTVSVAIADVAYGTVSVPTSVSTNEKASATITLTRAGGTVGAISVNVSTQDGSARAGVDYTVVNRTVTFADGVDTASIVIPVTDRTGEQGDRNFTVKVSDPQGGADLANDLVSVVITDVIPPPKSGGAMSWWLLACLPLTWRRRYARNNNA